jgi:hypothetical protein
MTWQETPLPPSGPSPIEQWLEHIRAGTTADDNRQRAVALTEFVVVANAAARAP